MTSLASAKWQHSRLRFRDFQTSILTNRATNGVKDCCGSALGRFDGRASDASAVLFLPCSVKLQRSEHSYTFSACWVISFGASTISLSNSYTDYITQDLQRAYVFWHVSTHRESVTVD